MDKMFDQASFIPILVIFGPPSNINSSLVINYLFPPPPPESTSKAPCGTGNSSQLRNMKW